MPQTNSGSLDWKEWGLSILFGFIGGGASLAVTSGALTASNPGLDLSILPTMGVAFLIGGVGGAALYLSKNSRPKYKTVVVTTETISAPSTSPVGLEAFAAGGVSPGMTKVTKVETYLEPLKEKE